MSIELDTTLSSTVVRSPTSSSFEFIIFIADRPTSPSGPLHAYRLSLTRHHVKSQQTSCNMGVYVESWTTMQRVNISLFCPTRYGASASENIPGGACTSHRYPPTSLTHFTALTVNSTIPTLNILYFETVKMQFQRFGPGDFQHSLYPGTALRIAFTPSNFRFNAPHPTY